MFKPMNEIPKVVFGFACVRRLGRDDDLRRRPDRAGERIFLAPLTIGPMRTIVFPGGAVAHVFAAHP